MGNNSTLSNIAKASLSANTTLSTATNGANQHFDDISQTAMEDIDGLLSSAFDMLRSTGFDGVTGLELERVTAMKEAITEYVGNIKTAIAPMTDAETTAQKAFGNRIAPAVQKFVMTVKNSCEALISNMEAFNADLDAVKKAMEAKAETVNSAVGATSSNLESTASKWTYSGSETN